MTIGAGPSPTRLIPSRFAAVALAATAVDLLVAVGLTEAGLRRVPADAIALVLAAIVSLVLHRNVTLRGDALDRWIRQPPVFVTVALVAGAIDMTTFVTLDSVAALGAKVIAILVAATVRAVAHRFVLFRAVRREQDRPAHRTTPAGVTRLSVVIPAYREGARIASTVQRVRRELAELEGELEVIVVDDGSPDDTAEVARQAGADQVLVQQKNRGKGAAVRAGVLVATGRTVAFTDADLAYSPNQILPMVAAIEGGWDVVIGNRHDNESEALVGTSALRSFGSRVVNMATHLMLLGNYRDTQCGCKAFRGDVAKLVMGSGRIEGFAFDIEILHLVERYGLSLCEVPVEVVNSDTSTVRAVRDGMTVARDIIRIRRTAARGGYDSASAAGLPAPGGALGLTAGEVTD